ncbi:MAG: TRAP transporter small permease subunit [Rhodospirillales bacterium]|nr:TRAP transporter small permease subunit [Rhodospirillales bacterium]
MLKRTNDLIEKTFLTIVWPLFFAYIVAIFVQVITRNYIQVTIIWLDEVARMCFLWTIMLGAAIAVRWQEHYTVEVIPPRFALLSLLIKIFAQIVMLIMIFVMLYHGGLFTQMGIHRESSALEIPWAYIYVSMPVAAAAMLFFWAEIFVNDLKKIRTRDRET